MLYCVDENICSMKEVFFGEEKEFLGRVGVYSKRERMRARKPHCKQVIEIGRASCRERV